MMIEKMRGEHIDGVYALLKAAFVHPWSERILKGSLERETSYNIVMTDDNRVIAYLSFEKITDEGSIELIAVDPSFRRQGIARRLLELILSSFPDLSVVTLEVRASNTPAISLYSSLGFDHIAVRKNYYRDLCEDAWIMQKKI